MAQLVRVDGEGQPPIPLDREPLTIGKAPDNRLVLEHTQVSRHHCVVRQSEGGRIQIEDLGSTNGTQVNDGNIELAVLRPGDEVVVGPFRFRVEEVAAIPQPAASSVGAANDELEIQLDDDLELSLDDPVASTPPQSVGTTAGDADLEISLASPCFLVFEKGERRNEQVEIGGERFTVGRNADNGLSLASTQVSGVHAELIDEGLGWTVRDLGSTNGTFVDDKRIDEQVLEHGQRVRFGDQRLVFWDSSVAEVEELEAQEAAVDDEEVLHHVSASDVPTRGKGGAVVALFLAVGLVGAAGFAYYKFGRGADATATFARVEGNLLPADVSSFEPGEGDRAWRPSEDESEGAFTTTAAMVHSGSGALDARLSEETPIAVARWQGRMAVQAERRYRLQGWIRTDAGASGGLRLLWLAEGTDENGQPTTTDLGASVPSLKTGRGEGPNGFVEFSGEARAPEGTTHALVECLGVGAGRVVIDDIAVLASERSAAIELESEGFDFQFNGASFAADRLGDRLLEGGGLTVVWGGRSWPQESFFPVDEREPRAAWSGDFRLGNGQVPLKQEVSKSDEGIVLSYAFEKLPEDAVILLRYRIRPELMSDGVAAVSGDETYEYGGAFNREDATAVIFGKGEDRLRFTTSAPADVSATATDGGYLVQHSLRAQELTVSIKTSFLEERREATRLLTEAGQHRRAGLHGQAFETYGRILRDYPFDPALQEKSRQARDELRREAEDGLAEIQSRIEDASFFHHPDSFAEAIDLASDLEQRFSGSEFAARAGEVRERAESEAQAFRQVSTEERAARLFRIAELASTRPDRKHLSEELFRQVAQLYPNTEHGRKAAAR